MSVNEKITMVHGSGGSATSELIESVFASAFSSSVLDKMEDAAVVEGGSRLAVTTDSFVITPLDFPGGNIGRLAVCGTVNDMLMRGAHPKYITCGWIIEEGTAIDDLKRYALSMAQCAAEAGVDIVAGDTKVVEGSGGVVINTAGVGIVDEKTEISAANAKVGDAIIVSGNMGDHHAAVLATRMGIDTDIVSDAAPLTEMVDALRGLEVHTLRDITRGGLGTVLKELSVASQKRFELKEADIPVSESVKNLCGILGLDPMYMGNEGKMVAIVAAEDADKVLDAIRSSAYGENAAIIGRVCEGEPDVIMETPIGGLRRIDVLQGEGLPRIC